MARVPRLQLQLALRREREYDAASRDSISSSSDYETVPPSDGRQSPRDIDSWLSPTSSAATFGILPSPLPSAARSAPPFFQNRRGERYASMLPPSCPSCRDFTKVRAWGIPGYWICCSSIKLRGVNHFCNRVFGTPSDPMMVVPICKRAKCARFVPTLERHWGCWGYACLVCKKFRPLFPPPEKEKKGTKKKK
jgi:hypothetical protein